MKKALFQFSLELGVFLKPASKGTTFEYQFNGPQSVKHLIEAAGVPHTEVSAVRANGAPVDFDYQVKDGDLVEVFSFSDRSLRASDFCERSNLNPDEPRFILDNHLGKLASLLRMLGFDCLYQNDFQDDQLAQLAQQTGRILLTRDHRLLMRKSIEQGYWLRSQHPPQQLQEVVIRYSMVDKIKPFQRCMQCNQLLQPVSKETILDRLQPLTKKYFEEFRICPACGQIYWQGSHYTKMLAFIENNFQRQA